MVKVLSFRFWKCFCPFIMLLVEGLSQTRLFRHLCNHFFRSTYICYEGHLFSKYFKIESSFPKCKKKKKKKSEKLFCFWDSCIWRCWNKLCHKRILLISSQWCCDELCLLTREYLSSAGNVLTNSHNILYITKRDFFELNCVHF